MLASALTREARMHTLLIQPEGGSASRFFWPRASDWMRDTTREGWLPEQQFGVTGMQQGISACALARAGWAAGHEQLACPRGPLHDRSSAG